VWRSSSTPVSEGLEVRYRTSSALHECRGQWFLTGSRGVILNLKQPVSLRMFALVISERCTSFDGKLGWVLTFQDLERQGCRARAYREVFTASPGKLIPIAASPSVQIIEPPDTKKFGSSVGYGRRGIHIRVLLGIKRSDLTCAIPSNRKLSDL